MTIQGYKKQTSLCIVSVVTLSKIIAYLLQVDGGDIVDVGGGALIPLCIPTVSMSPCKISAFSLISLGPWIKHILLSAVFTRLKLNSFIVDLTSDWFCWYVLDFNSDHYIFLFPILVFIFKNLF